MRLSHLSLLSSLVLSASLTVQASTANITPEPGLWVSDSTTLVNGIDMQERLRQMRDALLSQVPEAQRAMMQELLGDTGQVGERQCVTEAIARTMADPQGLLKEAQDQMTHCQLSTTRADANALQFAGQCNDPDGFTGELNGSLEILTTKEMRSSFNGQGRFPVPAGLLSDDAPASNDLVDFRHSQITRWVSSDCNGAPEL